jgi:hypothetical protein
MSYESNALIEDWQTQWRRNIPFAAATFAFFAARWPKLGGYFVVQVFLV